MFAGAREGGRQPGAAAVDQGLGLLRCLWRSGFCLGTPSHRLGRSEKNILTLILLLVAVVKVLHNMNTAQRKWVSLEPYQEQMKLKQNTGGFNYREVAKLLIPYT